MCTGDSARLVVASCVCTVADYVQNCPLVLIRVQFFKALVAHNEQKDYACVRKDGRPMVPETSRDVCKSIKCKRRMSEPIMQVHPAELPEHGKTETGSVSDCLKSVVHFLCLSIL